MDLCKIGAFSRHQLMFIDHPICAGEVGICMIHLINVPDYDLIARGIRGTISEFPSAVRIVGDRPFRTRCVVLSRDIIEDNHIFSDDSCNISWTKAIIGMADQDRPVCRGRLGDAKCRAPKRG